MKSVNMLVLCCLLYPAAVAWGDEPDWQLWLDQSLQGSPWEGWSARFKQQERWSDDASKFTHFHAEFDLTRKVNPWLALGAQYRQQFIKRGDDWFDENRPVVTGTVSGKIGKFAWSDRNRVEFRFREGLDTLVAYRNLLRISGPSAYTAWKIRPYVFDEIFMDSDQGELNRNRLALGFKCAPAERLRLDVYTLWQVTDQRGHWRDVMVVGARAGLLF